MLISKMPNLCPMCNVAHYSEGLCGFTYKKGLCYL